MSHWNEKSVEGMDHHQLGLSRSQHLLKDERVTE